jgi:hypothetical protein
LNAAIRGAKNSDHMQAMATDWIAPAFGTSLEIAQALAPYVNELGIGQLINEFPGAKGWVHTSIKKPFTSDSFSSFQEIAKDLMNSFSFTKQEIETTDF